MGRMARHDMSGPADTSMMGIVHSALRRDLERARLVLAAGDATDERRTAMAAHLLWMMAFLHDHHEAEDTGLYPGLEAAARLWLQDPSAQPKVQAALDALDLVLTPHLRHEETEMMPKVSAAITHGEWHEWDQRQNVGNKKPKDLAYTGHWLIDNATPADRDITVHEVPAVPRFVLLTFMGGPYQRARAAMWGGQPAADVAPIKLQAT
jgi:hypothetical protein